MSAGSPPRASTSSSSVPSTPIASTSQLFSPSAPGPSSTMTSTTTSEGTAASGLTTPTSTPQLNGNMSLDPPTPSANYTVRKTARSGPGIAPGNYAAQQPSVASTATTASGATSNTPLPLAPPSSSQTGQQQQQQQPQPWPALHLTPLNDTFVPKQISLYPPGTRVKIGRQTNAKTVPNNTNGYFDSKVLSRMHAEVWAEDGKVFIKDVKSSNGTFINGNRLSPEAAESDVFELHSDDQVEFGIDIVSDDSKTIVHHKVSARVFLVMNENDLSVSQREFNRWYREAGENPMGRRGAKVSQGSTANGLNFEHVFNRLQGELQKSRDTGASLGDISGTLTDVHDTLGGGVPPPLPPFARVPPYGASQNAQGAANANRNDAHAQSIAQLQSQLSETQSALSAHAAKIRDLEGMLREHESIKREVGLLKSQIDDAKDAMDSLVRARDRHGRESPVARLLESDDPSSASMTSAALQADADEDLSERERALREENASLHSRLESLSASLDRATGQGNSLRQQHQVASSTIASLEVKVQNLESAMKSQIDMVAWKEAFERDWHRDRQAWHAEREMLLDKVRQWESSSAQASASSSPLIGGSSSSASSQRAAAAAAMSSSQRRRRRATSASNGTASDGDGGDSSDDTRTLSTAITSPASSSSAASRRSTNGGGGKSSASGDWRSRSGGPDRFREGHGGLKWRSDGGQAHSIPQIAGAGTIVLIGVAAAWLASSKFKD